MSENWFGTQALFSLLSKLYSLDRLINLNGLFLVFSKVRHKYEPSTPCIKILADPNILISNAKLTYTGTSIELEKYAINRKIEKIIVAKTPKKPIHSARIIGRSVDEKTESSM